ncbi:MAG: aldehyde dehydrogenase family protein, partial [Pseudomonadota bacterium]
LELAVIEYQGPEIDSIDVLWQLAQDAVRRATGSVELEIDSALRLARLCYRLGCRRDELAVGDPWEISTDIGPVIDQNAKAKIDVHIEEARSENRLIKQIAELDLGTFVAPALIKIDSILDLEEEIFGPVLHVARFSADDIDQVISDINATGYGLTFGLHTRIDDRVQHIVDRVEVGNIYVNRNQIGAVVGSQPFGGEGLSGTGPKAGGPSYTRRFTAVQKLEVTNHQNECVEVSAEIVQDAIRDAERTRNNKPLCEISLPGPTGESNQLSHFGRGAVLCLGPSAVDTADQVALATEHGCVGINVTAQSENDNGRLNTSDLTGLEGIKAVLFWGEESVSRNIREALAQRTGAIVPLLTSPDDGYMLELERHVCIDTTASGGNTALLAAQS